MTEVIHRLGGHTMGTTWSVSLAGDAALDLAPLHTGIQRQLDAVVAQMSNWDADSELSRFNRADAGSRHRLSPGFDRVLQAALQIAEASGGAFDPTLGALVDAWGFGPSGRTFPQQLDQLVALRADTGWARLQCHDGHWLQPGGMQLDLCAIAKGHAVDVVSDWLQDRGIASALVDVGGELSGRGRKPDGSAWRVIVDGWEGDDDDATEPRILALDGLAVATSGDRWHHRDTADGRHSHTLDPRTGAPLHDAPTAVTVLAESAMLADGWATALGVLGVEVGFALARTRNMAARFIDSPQRHHRERMTPAFIDRLQV